MTAEVTLLKRWPAHLLKQIVSGNFVLVVGAGVSGASTNDAGESPPNWTTLIGRLASELLTAGPKRAVRDLIAKGRLLEAAELIRARSRAAGKEEDFLHLIARLTSGGTPEPDKFKPGPLHDSLMTLEPEIIVTTNYDKLLERATNNGYNVHAYTSNSLGRDVRSGNPSIVKVHGSIDDGSKIILTRSDYARLRRDGAEVLEVLQALFLTRTALFVGYSMGDPDIQLLLENVLGARGQVAAHYLLGSKALPEFQRDVFEYCYGTTVVPYADGDYAEMAKMVAILGVEVQSQRA
jgi:hypothetical protein